MAAAQPLVAPLGCERALEILDPIAKSGAADEIEATLTARSASYTRFAHGRIHQPQDVVEYQIAVRAFVDGHAARATTSSVEGVPETIQRAVETARQLGRAAATLRPGDPLPIVDIPLWHPDTVAFNHARRVALAADAMRAAESIDGTAAGVFSQAATELAVTTSSGIRHHALATEAGGALTVAAGDSSAHWMDLDRSSTRLLPDQRLEQTVQRAARGLGRSDLEPGTYTVVFGPEAVGEMLGFLDDFGFDGGLAAAGVGLVAHYTGERLVSPLVTIVDDALAPVGLPIPFDIEGTPKRAVPLFTKGVVGEATYDLATARAQGVTPTGHAHIAREAVPNPVSANVMMRVGDVSEDDLIAGVEDGVYVERLWYTRLVDRSRATITGVSRDGCFRIEHGRLTQPLTETRFTQSILAVFAGVDGIAKEPRSQGIMNVFNGVTTAPAIRTHGFRFGARQA